MARAFRVYAIALSECSVMVVESMKTEVEMNLELENADRVTMTSQKMQVGNRQGMTMGYAVGSAIRATQTPTGNAKLVAVVQSDIIG